MKKIFAWAVLLALFVTMLPVPAQAAETADSGTCGDSLTWVLDDEGTLIISGTGAMEDYTIGGAPWYDSCDAISSVVMEEGVTSVGSGAFYNCSSLASVTIPEGVARIGGYAFYGCNSLTGIVIPEGVTAIDDGAFSFCSSLTGIEIPAGVTAIGAYTFYGSGSLASVVIPEGVVTIGNSAFTHCGSLTGVALPESVTGIGDLAFGFCSSLTGMTLPEGVTDIGDFAFESCFSLTSVTIPEGVTSIGNAVFYNCSSLTDVTIPESVTSIGDWAFSDCSSLTGIVIPAGVSAIGSGAFTYCTGLTSVTIPAGVTSIGDSAFSCCTSLTGIYVDEDNPSYSSDEYGVLFNKDKTALILAPACGSYGNYSIPESVTSISDGAFHSCVRLTGVVIPGSVADIGEEAFYGCSSLICVEIPEGVAGIGWLAFTDCSSLICVEIPASVTGIAYGAFYGCSGLTDVYYGGSEEQWEAVTFGELNEELLNAQIHFNSTLPDDFVVVSATELMLGETADIAGKNLDKITWTASEDGIVEVDKENSRIKAVGVGTVVLTAAFESGSTVEFTFTVDDRLAVDIDRSEYPDITASANTEETLGEPDGSGAATAATDGDSSTYWHSNWSGTGFAVSADNPAVITVDLGTTLAIGGFKFQQRPETSNGVVYRYSYRILDADGNVLASGDDEAVGNADRAGGAWVVRKLDETVDAAKIEISVLEGQGGFAAIAEIEPVSVTKITMSDAPEEPEEYVEPEEPEEPEEPVEPEEPEEPEAPEAPVEPEEPEEPVEPEEPEEPEEPVEPEESDEPGDTESTEPGNSEPSEPDETEPEYAIPECDKDASCVLYGYKDIDLNEWYHDYIHFCVEAELMNGMSATEFAPGGNTTRAQLVTILYREAGSPDVSDVTEPFTDVAESVWFYKAVVWAYDNGVVNGTSDTTFAPEANVTREQVATILYRYSGSPAGTGDLSVFPDVNTVSAYAVPALTWAVGEGLINGVAKDGVSTLAPTGNATRAQIATILMRYLTAE